MPCYAKNPVLLITSGCRRTVCIHCRIDVQVSRHAETGPVQCEEVLRNLPLAVPTIQPPRHARLSWSSPVRSY